LREIGERNSISGFGFFLNCYSSEFDLPVLSTVGITNPVAESIATSSYGLSSSATS
jgi:hypothetical protein